VPLLDGIRGLAISSVLIFHAFFELAPHTPLEYAIRKTFAPLWFGVNIFFVLSGFLITGILMDSKGAPHYFRSFYARRTLRIFPLYFATLLCIFLLLPALHLLPSQPLSEQIGYWTYTYNWSAAWGHGVSGFVHLWSLAVEEQFYLVWPVLLFVTPIRRMRALFLSLLAASFLFRVSLFVLGEPFKYAYFLTPSRVEDLCFGALAAWTVRDAGSLARLRPAMPRLAWMFAGLFVIAFAAGKGFEASKWPALLFGTSAVCGLTALAIIQSTLETRQRWWGNRTLRWLGTYSYGIYVFHQPIVSFTSDRLAGTGVATYAAAMAGAVGVSCLAAWVSYHCFERYFLKLKERVRPA
jgi:peptidoglycan/LPS O-acetylase OafA/YrhL